MALTGRDQWERDGHLNRGVVEDPAPRAASQHLQSLARDDGEEQRRAEHEPRPGQEERGDAAVHRDLDEEIRNTPDQRQGRERKPGPPVHLSGDGGGTKFDELALGGALERLGGIEQGGIRSPRAQ